MHMHRAPRGQAYCGRPEERLSWAPEIPVRYITVGGARLRYITVGQGPALVLLHTLRTQLDMFRVVAPLAKRFRVYALDYPGHGYADIPKTEYTPELFVASVGGFLHALRIEHAVLVGESIGGSIALLLAARHHPAAQRFVAVNPYDYDRGRGLRRSSALANLFFGLNNVVRKWRPDEHRRPIGLANVSAQVRKNACKMLVESFGRLSKRESSCLSGWRELLAGSESPNYFGRRTTDRQHGLEQ